MQGQSTSVGFYTTAVIASDATSSSPMCSVLMPAIMDSSTDQNIFQYEDLRSPDAEMNETFLFAAFDYLRSFW